MCPWHGFEYDPVTGAPPDDYGDYATTYPIEERGDGLYVELPTYEYAPSRPAACFSIAGPGATNLLTGLWDAKVDRVPILALTGQVQSQVLGPGAFQEIPTAEAFSAVAEWSQTVVSSANASELMALAVKHAIVKRDVAHIIFPDEVQERPGLENPAERPIEGRVSSTSIAPSDRDLRRAVELLTAASRPIVIVGNGARPFRDSIVDFAERFDYPVVTTFKAKGVIADDHPLGCGTLGRSGTPVGSSMMGRADCLLVFGASFSNHTGISQKKPTIQVDFDRMMLGKFHPVEVPLWGEIERTLALLEEQLPPRSAPEVRDEIAGRKELWRAEKARRAEMLDSRGAMHPARLFEVLGRLVPDDAVLPVDVGNNTYAFGHYFECKANQDILMSGYLGSIGFALPAALGAWAAGRGERKVVSIGGDGGLGQYLADFATAVKYDMSITHIVLNNNELAKISREQVTALRPVWQTSLVNPDFAQFAELCGASGFKVDEPDELEDVLERALAVVGGPSLVEVRTSPRWV